MRVGKGGVGANLANQGGTGKMPGSLIEMHLYEQDRRALDPQGPKKRVNKREGSERTKRPPASCCSECQTPLENCRKNYQGGSGAPLARKKKKKSQEAN